jgi:hypothetical protein
MPNPMHLVAGKLSRLYYNMGRGILSARETRKLIRVLIILNLKNDLFDFLKIILYKNFLKKHII